MEITDPCQHVMTEIRVIESITTCETTVEVCLSCGQRITEPKTECS